MFSPEDISWMEQALSLAEQAAQCQEVPVGAVLVANGELIGKGFNLPITQQDPTAHAEIMALRAGAKEMGNYRLTQTTLYVTLEPCMMCAGAMIHARIKRVVYGAQDYRAGAIQSKLNLFTQSFVNHRIEYAGGLLASECSLLLSQFFQAKRKK